MLDINGTKGHTTSFNGQQHDNVKGWMAKTRIRYFQSEKSNTGDFDQ